MKRTTILADEGLLLEAKYLANREGKSVTWVIHEALAEYITARRPERRLPDWVGRFDSGDPSFAERDEEILAAETHAIDGWSRKRVRSGTKTGRGAGTES